MFEDEDEEEVQQFEIENNDFEVDLAAEKPVTSAHLTQSNTVKVVPSALPSLKFYPEKDHLLSLTIG